MLGALITPAAGGKLRVYSGTRPTDADTALSGNTLLAELTLGSPAYPSASGGVLTANTITGDTSADATGTASFVRVLQSDGTTVMYDLSVGVGTGEVQFSTLSFVAGVAVNLTSFTITNPVGT
jgi:hypothetical protein